MICPFAIWRGPIPNKTVRAIIHPVRGLVLHVEVGTEAGTDSWFHNSASQASAHFGIAKDGSLHQWVDTNDKAWAEANYNPYWYSVETEGYPAEPLTDAQVQKCGQLLAWLAHLDGFPIQVTDDPNGRGLITHGALGSPGGSHYGCPGDARKAQRAAIVAAATNGGPVVVPPQPGPIVLPSPIPDDPYSVEVMVTQMPVVQQGTTGQYAKIAQSLINANGANPLLSLDGDFGAASANALKRWQSAAGLVDDGVCGPKTWRRLLCI